MSTKPSHDADTPASPNRGPANRLELDYRRVPPRRVPGRIVDVHTHVHAEGTVKSFIEAADAYGIDKVVSMSPLEDVDTLRAQYGARLEFTAVPRWRKMENTPAFRHQWLDDLVTFREKGARRMKFWMAPPMRGKYSLTLKDPYFEPVIRHALDLGYDFMIHVGDPSEWFAPGKPYADVQVFGTKLDQYPQLEYLLETVAPRNVIAAHMGGSIEDPAFLRRLLNRHPNLYLDTSATKWIVRGVARQPEAVRELLIDHAGRILFGSDLVVAEKYDFDHYASRYWVHQTMWETAYDGPSPIEDPDAGPAPRLAGLDLPPRVLTQIYAENAARLGY